MSPIGETEDDDFGYDEESQEGEDASYDDDDWGAWDSDDVTITCWSCGCPHTFDKPTPKKFSCEECKRLNVLDKPVDDEEAVPSQDIDDREACTSWILKDLAEEVDDALDHVRRQLEYQQRRSARAEALRASTVDIGALTAEIATLDGEALDLEREIRGKRRVLKVTPSLANAADREHALLALQALIKEYRDVSSRLQQRIKMLARLESGG